MNHDERIEAHIAQQLVNEACDQIAAEIKDGITPERICHEWLSMFSIFVSVPTRECYAIARRTSMKRIFRV